VPLIDLGDELLGFGLERTVGREFAAGGSRRLNEYKSSKPFGMAAQQIVDRANPIEDALRIVEPLDADGDANIGGQRETTSNRVTALAYGRLLG
jgi:hypothetical protein